MADSKLLGARALRKALNDMPAALERKVVGRALKEGALIQKHAAQARVPVRSGALKKHIGIKSSRRRGSAKARVAVFRKRGSKPDPFYASFVERGTKNMVGTEFMLQSYVASATSIFEAVRRRTAEGVDAWARDTRGKTKMAGGV